MLLDHQANPQGAGAWDEGGLCRGDGRGAGSADVSPVRFIDGAQDGAQRRAGGKFVLGLFNGPQVSRHARRLIENRMLSHHSERV